MADAAVVAEHTLLVEAPATSIEAEDELSVVGTATDSTGATDLAERHPVDLILLDLDLPDGDGVALARRLREIRPQARMILLSGRWDPSLAAWALRFGACGLVLKGRPVDELLRVLHGALRGETQGPQRLLTEVLSGVTHPPGALAPPLGGVGQAGASRPSEGQLRSADP